MPMANRGKIRPERTVQGKSCSEAGLEKENTFVNSRHAMNPMEMYHAETEILREYRYG